MILLSHCAQLLRAKKFFSRSHDAVIRVYDAAGNVIATREHKGSSKLIGPRSIHGCDAAPTPTGFAEIVSDDFPILHAERVVPLLLSLL